jgi:hypothetical protein
VAAVAGTLALATPANAAGSSPALPFPTVCGTATTASGSASASASATPSASASPKPSASGSTTSPAKAGAAKSPSATASPSASSSTSGTATPSPSPSASSSSPSAGGFWGWLNGVWTWIFGAAQLPHAAAAPAIEAGYVRTGTGAEAGAAKAQPVSLIKAASASPSPTASCVPSSQVKQNAASSDGNTAAQIPWHLSTPSMTQYSLTYNGITTIKTVGGGTLQVLDFTAAKVTLLSMVTFSHQGGTKLQYVNGGPNQTVTLTGVHLWTTELKANLLGLIPVDYTPSSPPPLPIGLTIPLPLLFTSVEADNAFLTTQSIVIPGFDGHGN